MPKKLPKNKSKRRRIIRLKKEISKKRKRSLVGIAVFFILSVAAGGGTYYAYFYQSVSLTSENENDIVRSYYLLRDFQQELEAAGNQSEEETASLQNIRYLATNLSSYNTSAASNLNTVEGQSALNRYFNALSELGINATRESQNFYGNPELVAEFIADIERTIGYETTAFDYYRVNQSALESELSDGE
ncbi:hypothetical protein [Enterococcus sp. HY326]|uniref:hypothetical protein n=1 Tax=Enterococcus sp. HY326 TaxID=2971265 RepID=UPI002240DD73|nr:hypothetical protein [Enterococcus sp. HY326]